MDHKKPANIGFKKRDNKAIDKKHAGTVAFADSSPDKKKKQSKGGFNKGGEKKDFNKGPKKFQKTGGQSKSPY